MKDMHKISLIFISLRFFFLKWMCYFFNCGDKNKTEVKVETYRKKFMQSCIKKNW